MTKSSGISWLLGIGALLVAAEHPLALAQEGNEAEHENRGVRGAEPKDEKEGLPLKPERKIEFTTDEGTWISLDVSPAGTTIIFDLLGDLYSLPIEGGEAALVAGGMAFESQPRYSPDGSRIAFLSDREGAENVWIADADGSNAKRLSNDDSNLFTSPGWTSDGDNVLVSRRTENGFEIWMYHVGGGAGIQLVKVTPPPGTPGYATQGALGAIAGPGGRYVYYAKGVGKPAWMPAGSFGRWQIARRDLLTGVEELITEALGSAIRPRLSPDGTKLVYGTRYDAATELRIRDFSTGEDRRLKYAVQRDDQESPAAQDLLPGYAFTPDGKEVVLSYGGKIHRVDIESGDTKTIPFVANVRQDLGPLLDFPSRVDDGPVRVRLIHDPSQSPDGKRLAFSALTHLYSMEIPSGTPRRVNSGDDREFHPAWSPDGQWLAYVTWSADGGDIWKARVDGQGSPRKLTQVPGYYRHPIWTPDGARIVALRGLTGVRVKRIRDYGPYTGTPSGDDIVWVPAGGGEARLIVPARGLGRLHFGEEKTRIYASSKADGLVSFRFDATERRSHLKVTRSFDNDTRPTGEIIVSPNGRYAAARILQQLYVMVVPRVGGDAPTVNVSAPSVPAKIVSEVGADYMAWADDGSVLTWGMGSSFFRARIDDIFAHGVKQLETGADTDGTVEHDALPIEEIDVKIELPRHRPRGSIVLRGANVVTMRGEEVIENADIVVSDNRITFVGRRGAADIPDGARVFDVSGATIMPGIIDVHAHWFEIRRGLLDMQNWPFLANLAYGVTAGRDPQTSTNDTFAYQDLVDVGEIPGPRAFSTGPGVFDIRSASEASNVVTRYKKYYRAKTIKNYAVGNREKRQWFVQAAKEHRIMPTTEAWNLKLHITHVIDGFSGNEHSIPVFPLYRDVVELIARSGLTYTPTLLLAYGGPHAENVFYVNGEVHDDPKLRRFIPHNVLDLKTRRGPWYREDEHVYRKLARSAAKIVRAGGRVCVGGHGQLQGIQCHWEMWALQSGGMTNLEVLRAATLHGAEAIGYAQDLGSIEEGKLADLIVLNRDPLEDIRNTNTIRYVMKNGELFEGDTLNQVWPQQKALPPLWWWNDEP